MHKLPKSICFSKKKQKQKPNKSYSEEYIIKEINIRKKKQPINKQKYTKGNKQKQNKQNTK